MIPQAPATRRDAGPRGRRRNGDSVTLRHDFCPAGDSGGGAAACGGTRSPGHRCEALTSGAVKAAKPEAAARRLRQHALTVYYAARDPRTPLLRPSDAIDRS
jgi:hypothetical protein